ncbi:MAG: hypothetical protein WAU32_10770 [Thermoanaerobaculia bacterium]
MPYLLDGNNLIGTARGRGRPTAEDRAALVAEIADRLRRSRARAVLYFDGPVGDRGASLGSLSVRPSSGGSADDAIVREVEGAGDPGSMIVVTADRELGRRVRDAGGKTCAPPEFFARFGQSGGGGEAKPGAGPVDVEEWLRYFGDEGNRKPSE